MKPFHGGSSISENRQPGSLDFEVTFGLPTPLCGRFADPRRNKAFSFEPFERRLYCTNRGGAIGDAFDFGANRRPVSAAPQPHYGEQYDMLEFTEVSALRHIAYMVDNMMKGCQAIAIPYGVSAKTIPALCVPPGIVP